MRGNPNTKTLQSVENKERILRNRNKEKVNIPQFYTSSSQYLHNIPESKWETSVERVRSKSKYESDLKKVETNPRRLESYLCNVPNPLTSKEDATIILSI